MVDVIASLGCVPFEMDAWGVDVAVAGSQKGLMMVPGLSFNAAGPKAKRANETAGLRTRYWDWQFRDGDEHYQKYCGTAPEHMMFGLRKSLDLLFEEGLENAQTRHRLLAEATRRAVDVWRRAGGLDFNISDPAERADSVTTIVMAQGHDPQILKDYCQQTCGDGGGDLRRRNRCLRDAANEDLRRQTRAASRRSSARQFPWGPRWRRWRR